MIAILAMLAAVGVPPALEAHGRKAVPDDPVLLEQYKAGLGAFYGNDYAAALEALQPVAERETGSSAAQIFLGFIYETGLGLAKDPILAADWYRRAAEQDNMLAQIRLALIYRRGEGAAPDHLRAYLWAPLAARREGHLQGVAEALRDSLAQDMTPVRIAEARTLADAWIETHSAAE
jgi:TPR repeat protein